MAALITVAGIDTGTNQTVTDVKACPQGSLHIGAVIGVDIHSVICFRLLCGIDEFAYDLVGVRTAGILGTDTDLTLRAAQAAAYATHINGNRFCDAVGEGTGTAVTNFFINSNVQISLAL